MITPLFSTPLYQQRSLASPAELAELRDYLLALRGSGAGEQRSNRGGWHSAGNLFDPAQHRQFAFLREAITRAVLEFTGEAFGFRGDVTFSLTGWSVINGPGDYNVPHNHSRNFLSGAFYVAVPEGMTGGEIVFSDPRFNLNSYLSAQMQERGWRAPWDITTIPLAPAAGELLIFPSWLVHYVNSFTAPEPDAVRIVVSFNVGF